MRGKTVFLILLVISAIDLAVPYLLIGDLGTFAGSYLFWCVLPLVVIVAAAIHTRHWGGTA